MNPLDRRLSKLERKDVGIERTIIIITVLEPSSNGPVEHEAIGLADARGADMALLWRLPGESIAALHARAERDHPEVHMWVTQYRQDQHETVKPFNSTVRT
jgi:hypothetical protein